MLSIHSLRFGMHFSETESQTLIEFGKGPGVDLVTNCCGDAWQHVHDFSPKITAPHRGSCEERDVGSKKRGFAIIARLYGEWSFLHID